ncbi:MAG: ABC transporter ATP-binding protein [Deltaproteobacteria bacterium]|nr:ABC transporter ATP-binding protein [Deltaproteobacteria bacterium]MBW1961721.1 ABC transporter ATP-binding protein [Deltaproteobacteria bacterium]MBW2153785.1 ABC transporter ATP-binding protein [Deltaproteobacteria bacterium]
MTAIDIQNITHCYGYQPVLKDISLSIREGTFFTILGPNGSGKTTLMKIISGIEKPRQGSVKIIGQPLERYKPKNLARTVAFLPQTISVDFQFTVTELILMGRAPHQGILGLEDQNDRRAATEAMRFVGVEHLADRKLDQLSGGERQRVYIAKAICQEPKIILLDEPTAFLDLAHQIHIMNLMERLKTEKGVTVVMVSHDVNLAAMYAECLMLLKDGKIVKTGPPNDVLTGPTLEKTYECLLFIDKSPIGDFPRVMLVPDRLKALQPR